MNQLPPSQLFDAMTHTSDYITWTFNY